MSINEKHTVFISYHHANDQKYKNYLIQLNDLYDIFIDKSVNTGDIDDSLDDQSIREKIRDEFLKDSTVTILLVGSETWGRKHIDWELYSSMYDGVVNKKSGILVVNLPTANSNSVTVGHGDQEKMLIHPNKQWMSIKSRVDYEIRYPKMPARIIDNLLNQNARISVVPWSLIENDPLKLKLLIEFTNSDRVNAQYDLSRDMRRKNANE